MYLPIQARPVMRNVLARPVQPNGYVAETVGVLPAQLAPAPAPNALTCASFPPGQIGVCQPTQDHSYRTTCADCCSHSGLVDYWSGPGGAIVRC